MGTIDINISRLLNFLKDREANSSFSSKNHSFTSLNVHNITLPEYYIEQDLTIMIKLKEGTHQSKTEYELTNDKYARIYEILCTYIVFSFRMILKIIKINKFNHKYLPRK